MSVVPSVSASPSALFAGLFGASGSGAGLVPSQQSPSKVLSVSDGAPEFGSLLQKTQQQFAGTPLEHAIDLTGDHLPVVTAFDLAGQQIEGPASILEADSDTESNTELLPFLSLPTFVGAGFEQPNNLIESEIRPGDVESDSDDPREPAVAEIFGVPFIHTDNLAKAVVPYGHHPPVKEISYSIDGQSEDPAQPAVPPAANAVVADTTAKQTLKDLRSELEDQLGVQPRRRRSVAEEGQREAVAARLSTEVPQSSVSGIRRTSQDVAPVVDFEQQSRIGQAVESISLTKQTGTSPQSNEPASPLATSQATNLQPVPSSPLQNNATLGSLRANVQQSPVESTETFASASVLERSRASATHHPSVAELPAQSAVSTTPGSPVATFIQTPTAHAVSAIDPRAQQASSSVAGGVSQSERVRNSEESEPAVDESTKDSVVDSDGANEVSTTRQQPKDVSDRNGRDFVPPQLDSSDVPSFLDKSSAVTTESVKPSPTQLPDPLQAVDADLDLLQQLLPRDSSVANVTPVASSINQTDSLITSETLNLPQQIATRALSEAEVLESGDSSHFRMKLDPPELGSVMIEMQKSILGTTITVTAADPATQQLLQDSLQNLNQNEAGETGLFDNLTFDLATGDQGQQSQQQEDGRSDSRVVRLAENRPVSSGSNANSDTTSEVDFVA